MNALTFLRTLTVEEFKSESKTTSISVKENPKKAGSFFMCNSANNVIGAVSTKMATEGVTKPVVSEVSDGTNKFFMLHNQGEGGAGSAATIFTL